MACPAPALHPCPPAAAEQAMAGGCGWRATLHPAGSMAGLDITAACPAPVLTSRALSLHFEAGNAGVLLRILYCRQLLPASQRGQSCQRGYSNATPFCAACQPGSLFVKDASLIHSYTGWEQPSNLSAPKWQTPNRQLDTTALPYRTCRYHTAVRYRNCRYHAALWYRTCRYPTTTPAAASSNF